MSQVVNGTDVSPDHLKALYAPIDVELTQSEEILQRELRNEHAAVDEMVRYGCLLGGKRLRPALLLLTAKALGVITADHLTLAAVVEMIHTATLVHDDILDDAVLRRHMDTCNARWDNEASVLLGDYLFTHSFYLASTLDSTYACRTIGKATNVVCEGELRQIRSCNNFELGEEEYLEIIEAKTASLCACACRLGAYYADASTEYVEVFSEYGRNLGIAFQIIDDLLDVAGNESSVGKSLGTDLEKQKPTLPLLHVLSCLKGTERTEFVNALVEGSNGHEIMKSYLQRFQSRAYCLEKANVYASRAVSALADLSDNEATRILLQLPEFVIHRSH
ncbi:MAG: polyprenyl synthetase [Planctomycetaceae bacterium]|nr:polyprenyl synthetase [Planctomycetaceae bacterium]MBP60325.1 polyprenyl synthetase [Planctomycetaceae bacterium]